MTQKAGFTLIELLIVIAILGVLAAVLLPNILGATDTSNDVATKATMQQMNTACEAYSRKRGYFPPDDQRDPEGKLVLKNDNGQNTGVESLFAFCSQARQEGGTDLSGLAEHFMDTDKDNKKEIGDAWGTPFVYFSKSGMEKTQNVTLLEMDAVPVKALRREDGTLYGAGKFQIVSAGKDKTFGTSDDLHWPDN